MTKSLDDWERMPSRCIPASSCLRVVREKQEANAREAEEDDISWKEHNRRVKERKKEAKLRRQAEENATDPQDDQTPARDN